MFELKGKFLTSRYYARHIPLISRYVYEMSFVENSSVFYRTIPYPTRMISLDGDFSKGYSHRLQKYLRNTEISKLEIKRPYEIEDIETMFQPVIEAKNLGSLPPGTGRHRDHYFYSEVHHPDLGRLAAHISIADQEEKIVFGLVNASDFRKFSSKEHQRKCSVANKYLFHRDMIFFQDAGYRFYDMVGTGEPVNQMKKEFGGEIVMTYTHTPVLWYILQKFKRLLR